jgi:hypothetical protein
MGGASGREDIGEQLLKLVHSVALRTRAGVCVNFQGCRHVRMPKLSLCNLQRGSLRMPQSAVRVTECMPIDSLQTGSPARGAFCLLSEIIRRKRNTLVSGKHQTFQWLFREALVEYASIIGGGDLGASATGVGHGGRKR